MRQFLVAAARPGAVLEVDGSDYHYLVRVLRLRRGAVIPVADAAGRRARATVTAVSDGHLRLLVAAEPPPTGAPATATRAATGPAPAGAPPAPTAGRPDAAPLHGPAPAHPANAADAGATPGAAHAAAPPATAHTAGALTLVQALPRGALMDRIVRQATELGVTRIVPLVAERSQGRADPGAQARRLQRWQRIARQAAQQSGSAPPAIEPPLALARYLGEESADGIALLFEPGAPPLPAGIPLPVGDPGGLASERHNDASGDARGALPAAQRTAAGAAAQVAVWCAVGPEGDFSPSEAALFRHRGYRAVGLPCGVLRVDTAVVAALTATRLYLASLTIP